MVPIALAYGAGLLAGRCCPLPLALLFAALGLVLGIGFLRAQARPWVLLVGFLLAGWTNLVIRTATIDPTDLRRYPGDQTILATVKGRLTESPSKRLSIRRGEEVWRSLVILEAAALRGEKDSGWRTVHGKVLVTTPDILDEDFFNGQSVEVTGVLQLPPIALAEGLFDYRAYLRNHGIYHQLRAGSTNDWRLLSPGRPRPWADRFLAWAQTALGRGLPAEDEALHLLWAMTLGWKSTLTPDVYQPFMTSGTLHIFAISGLHIALIALICVHAVKLVRLSRLQASAGVIGFLWFYTAATGWQPSAIRATVMMSIIIGGWALRRPSDLINSLAAAGLLILICDPLQLFGASFQLSFFVVLSLALLTPPLMDLRERVLRFDPLLPPTLAARWQQRLMDAARSLWALAATSLAAWLGSLPITAYYFHLFSPVTVLANLILVPLSTLALAANLASLTFACVPPMAELFNHSAWLFMVLMMRASEWASLLPGAFWHVKGPGAADLILYYGILLLLLWGGLRCWGGRMAVWVAAGTVASGWLVFHVAYPKPVHVALLAEGGGAAVFVQRAPGHPPWLIDSTHSNTAPTLVTAYLHAQGYDALPTLALTHGDVQHVGGAAQLIETFSIHRLFVSPVRFRSPAYRQTVAAFPTNRLVCVRAGERLGPWEVLYPEGTEPFTLADERTLVLRGEFANTSLLYLSDLAPRGQDCLLSRGAVAKTDIVVTGLPSAGEPLRDALLEQLRPQVIVILDANFPATQRPSPAVLNRLARGGATVIQTRIHGSVVLEFRAGDYEIRAASGLRLRGKGGIKSGPAEP